jgi:integrase
MQHHKATGQARVRIRGKDHYLGLYGSPTAQAAYNRLIADYLSGQLSMPVASEGPLLIELMANYHAHVRRESRTQRDTPGAQVYHVATIIADLSNLYPDLPADAFGPKALRALRAIWIQRGWSRRYINQQTSRLVHMIRWAASHEMVDVSRWHALRAVPHLRKGGSHGAPDRKPVKPVPGCHVLAVLPLLRSPVRAMVALQLLTGARPEEIRIMRCGDIDFDGPGMCWLYEPGWWKLDHREHDLRRVIPLGPRAQAILRPLLRGDSSAYVFRPADAVKELCAMRRASRKSPRWPSHSSDARRRRYRGNRRRQVQATEYYRADSYRSAIKRACEKAAVPPWTPYRLRHTAATAIRRRFDLDSARAVLGHSFDAHATTEIYAERDLALAASVAREVG